MPISTVAALGQREISSLRRGCCPVDAPRAVAPRERIAGVLLLESLGSCPPDGLPAKGHKLDALQRALQPCLGHVAIRRQTKSR